MGPSTRVIRLKTTPRERELFQRLKVKTLGEVAQFTRHQLLGKKGVGKATLDSVVALLKRAGLELSEPVAKGFCPLKAIRIGDLGLSVRTRNHLFHEGVRTLYGITRRSPDRLNLVGLEGVVVLDELTAMLKHHGLKMKEPEQEPTPLGHATALGSPIGILRLSVRAAKPLKAGKYYLIRDLASATTKELRQLQNFGNISITEVRQKLAKLGLGISIGCLLPKAKSARGTQRKDSKNMEQPVEQTTERASNNEYCQAVRVFIRDDEGRKVEVEVVGEGGTLFITPRDHVHGNVSEPDYKLATDDGFGGHPIFLKLVAGRVKLFAFPSKANNVPMVIDMEGAKELRKW